MASTRSKAVGVPPRWTWPRTVARASWPVRSSISASSQWPIPPRRAWPKASVAPWSAIGIPPFGSAPSETTTIGAYWLSNRVSM